IDLGKWLKTRQLRQAKAPEIVGVSQSRVSDLTRGKWEKFSLVMLTRSSRDYQSSRSWSYKLHLRAFYLSQVCALCFDQVETLRRFSFLSDVEESPVTDRRQ
ncbi:MAG: XRE family transcriptional regulator, partial [Deltaproteobacteria bacterium]|nr:XRE family transcriptional regulator [Deltaproteobacteria bacterium]